MTEHEPPERPNPRWTDFTASLPDAEHKQLMVALGTGLHEARKAAQVAADNGLVTDARQALDLAIDWLSDARRRLDTERSRET